MKIKQFLLVEIMKIIQLQLKVLLKILWCDVIEISITLKANTRYAKNGNLIIDKITKFVTKITNFKEGPKITKTYVINPIDASSIGLGDKLTKDAVSENVINAIYFWK